jgi:periplasmic divalent cation tolerance protein
MSEDTRVVFISIPRDEARKMARALVEGRFAACANIIPAIESFYWWDDAVQHDEESLLVVKTTQQRFEALMEFVEENHPYELPEIIAIPLADGLPDYIEWVREETEKL